MSNQNCRRPTCFSISIDLKKASRFLTFLSRSLCKIWAERGASPCRRLFFSHHIIWMTVCIAYLTHSLDLKLNCEPESDGTISFQDVVWFLNSIYFREVAPDPERELTWEEQMVSSFSQVVAKHTLSWYNPIPSHHTIRRIKPIMHHQPCYLGVAWENQTTCALHQIQ